MPPPWSLGLGATTSSRVEVSRRTFWTKRSQQKNSLDEMNSRMTCTIVARSDYIEWTVAWATRTTEYAQPMRSPKTPILGDRHSTVTFRLPGSIAPLRPVSHATAVGRLTSLEIVCAPHLGWTRSQAMAGMPCSRVAVVPAAPASARPRPRPIRRSATAAASPPPLAVASLDVLRPPAAVAIVPPPFSITIHVPTALPAPHTLPSP